MKKVKIILSIIAMVIALLSIFNVVNSYISTISLASIITILLVMECISAFKRNEKFTFAITLLLSLSLITICFNKFF